MQPKLKGKNQVKVIWKAMQLKKTPCRMHAMEWEKKEKPMSQEEENPSFLGNPSLE